ncbi:MAG: periplasmic heavy metal sensor [Elusimicrobia bacterium]|nr:periplasmic heavy metal sensor [Elusimicrobiota bacterium]
MRHRSWVALIGLLAVCVTAAQAKDRREHGGKDPGDMKARWAEHMGLSKDQAGKLESAFQERRKAMKPLRRELRDAMLQLRDKVEDEAGDAAMKPALDRVQKAKQAVRAEQERFHAKLGETLSPRQRARFLLAHGGRRGPGMHGMKQGCAMGRSGMMGGTWKGQPGMQGRGHGMRRERRGEPEERMKDAVGVDDEDDDAREPSAETDD